MYRMIVRRNVRAAFAALSENDTSLVDRMSTRVEHTFPGRNALGGYRSDRAAVGSWFDRLFRLLPGLVFRVESIAVDGWPWDTTVGVEWTNSGVLLDGSPYANRGTHVIRMRWLTIVSFHAYVHDLDAIDDALARVAATGLAEATAPPILAA